MSNQRFESIINLARINLITWHTSTQRVSYGNLSQAHLRISTSYPNPRLLVIPTNTRLWISCVSAYNPQFRALLVGNVQYSVRRFQSVKYCELRRFTGPINGMWLVLFNSLSRDSLKRALIDTGEATSPRKECRGTYPSLCRVLLDSPGLNF